MSGIVVVILLCLVCAAGVSVAIVVAVFAIRKSRRGKRLEAQMAHAPIGVGLIEKVHWTTWVAGVSAPGLGDRRLYRFDIRVETENGQIFGSRAEKYMH